MEAEIFVSEPPEAAGAYSKWSEKDKQQLKVAVEANKYNNKVNWAAVAQQMTRRDASQCKSYYRVLLRRQEQEKLTRLFQTIDAVAEECQLARKKRIRVYIYCRFYNCDWELLGREFFSEYEVGSLERYFKLTEKEYGAQMQICGLVSRNLCMDMFSKAQLKYLFDYISALKYYLDKYEAGLSGAPEPDKPRLGVDYEDLFAEPIEHVELSHIRDVDAHFSLKTMQRNIWKAFKRLYF